MRRSGLSYSSPTGSAVHRAAGLWRARRARCYLEQPRPVQFVQHQVRPAVPYRPVHRRRACASAANSSSIAWQAQGCRSGCLPTRTCLVVEEFPLRGTGESTATPRPAEIPEPCTRCLHQRASQQESFEPCPPASSTAGPRRRPECGRSRRCWTLVHRLDHQRRPGLALVSQADPVHDHPLLGRQAFLHSWLSSSPACHAHPSEACGTPPGDAVRSPIPPAPAALPRLLRRCRAGPEARGRPCCRKLRQGLALHVDRLGSTPRSCSAFEGALPESARVGRSSTAASNTCQRVFSAMSPLPRMRDLEFAGARHCVFDRVSGHVVRRSMSAALVSPRGR